jgi:hypothetical protein
MSMLGSKDNETRSYLEIVDALRQYGALPQAEWKGCGGGWSSTY